MAKRWRTYIVGGLAISALVTWLLWLQRHSHEILASLEGLRERRNEPAVILELFLVVALSAPLAIVPSGVPLIAGMAVGYIYRFSVFTFLLGWLGFSTGLLLMFCVARAVSRCWACLKPQKQVEAPDNCVEEVSTKTQFFEEVHDVHEQGDEGCLDNRTLRALLKAAKRLLKERPYRATLLLTFASWVPLTVVLLGSATDVALGPVCLACLANGVKILSAILKGIAAADVVALASSSSDQSSHSVQLALYVIILVALGFTMCYVVRAAKRELEEVERADVDETRARLLRNLEE